MKSKDRLKKAQKEAESTIKKTNEKIVELGAHAKELNSSLNEIQIRINLIRNVPTEQRIKFQEAQEIILNWNQQVEEIEKNYTNSFSVASGVGAAGAGAGVAVVAMGPSAAMGIATTFGVASTGTAISSLSGAAATSAALAWLGGGTVAMGAGGMAAGKALLALAGPIGWSIAAVSIVSSGISLWFKIQDKHRLEEIYTLVNERETKSYSLAIVEMNERMVRMDTDIEILNESIEIIRTFGRDYSDMTERQQYELGALVNQVAASTQLLVNPIQGLQPKYTEEDYKFFISVMHSEEDPKSFEKCEPIILSLANLLYQIPIDENDKKLLGKSLKSNKKFLKSYGIKKRDFDVKYIDLAKQALSFKYE